MIAVILNDCQRDGTIQSWHIERRMMFPDQYVVTENSGREVRWSRRGIEDFCVGLAIGRGEIPDPHSTPDEGSYPCTD